MYVLLSNISFLLWENKMVYLEVWLVSIMTMTPPEALFQLVTLPPIVYIQPFHLSVRHSFSQKESKRLLSEDLRTHPFLPPPPHANKQKWKTAVNNLSPLNHPVPTQPVVLINNPKNIYSIQTKKPTRTDNKISFRSFFGNIY